MATERVQKEQYPHGALPIGTRLGEFEIRRVLGVGGFGIVYLAFDHLLEREVAVKEYMPAALVGRDETMHVSLLSHANADTFALGLRSFVNESRLLARFDHPSLVKVHRFWEANGTAYMAMSLYRGRTVRDVRQAMQTRPTEAWVRSVLEPLLGAIEKLHSEDVFHRDIAPDNILIEADGRPVLLDFGAARRVIADRSQALTAILKPSYAPIEQYAEVPGMKQGAWTDIYALGATVHFLLLGRPPPPAPGRTIQDEMKPLVQQTLEGCSPQFLAVVDWMLSPRPNERPQSVNEVREALAGRLLPPQRSVQEPLERYERTEPMPGPAGRPAVDGIDAPTMVMPRPGGPAATAADAPTMVMPRSGGQTGVAPAARPAAPAAAAATAAHDPDATVVTPRPAAPPDDADATVVTPRPTAYVPPRQTVVAPAPTTARPAERPAPPPQRSTVTPPPVELRAPPPAPGRGSQIIPVVVGALIVLGGAAAWLFWSGSRTPAAPPPVAVQTPPPQPAPAPVVPTPVAAPTTPVATPDPAAASAAAAATREQNAVIEQLLPPPAAKPAESPGKPAAAAPAAQPQPRPAAPATRPPLQRPADNPPAGSYGRVPEAAPAPARVQPAPEPVAPPAPQAHQGSSGPAAPVAAAEPAAAAPSPIDKCKNEMPLVRLVCVDIACGKAEFKAHPECVKLRAEQAHRRDSTTK